MNNLGGPELVFIAVLLLLVGVAPYVTWRRGGSKLRITIALLVSLIPYGFIVGMIIALTAKRSGASARSAMRSEQATLSGGVVTTRGGLGRTLGIIGVVVGVLLALIASGATGYYLAQRDNGANQPTWVDREIRSTGTQNVGTLRCTYHLADGTVIVRESVIALSTTPPNPIFGTRNPLGARTPDCPSSP